MVVYLYLTASNRLLAFYFEQISVKTFVGFVYLYYPDKLFSNQFSGFTTDYIYTLNKHIHTKFHTITGVDGGIDTISYFVHNLDIFSIILIRLNGVRESSTVCSRHVVTQKGNKTNSCPVFMCYQSLGKFNEYRKHVFCVQAIAKSQQRRFLPYPSKATRQVKNSDPSS